MPLAGSGAVMMEQEVAKRGGIWREKGEQEGIVNDPFWWTES